MAVKHSSDSESRSYWRTFFRKFFYKGFPTQPLTEDYGYQERGVPKHSPRFRRVRVSHISLTQSGHGLGVPLIPTLKGEELGRVFLKLCFLYFKRQLKKGGNE